MIKIVGVLFFSALLFGDASMAFDMEKMNKEAVETCIEYSRIPKPADDEDWKFLCSQYGITTEDLDHVLVSIKLPKGWSIKKDPDNMRASIIYDDKNRKVGWTSLKDCFFSPRYSGATYWEKDTLKQMRLEAASK